MLLRIELGAGGWKKDRFKTRMGIQHGVNRRAFVPTGAIPKQEDGLGWVTHQQITEKVGGDCSAAVFLEGIRPEIREGSTVENLPPTRTPPV